MFKKRGEEVCYEFIFASRVHDGCFESRELRTRTISRLLSSSLMWNIQRIVDVICLMFFERNITLLMITKQ